MSSKPKKSGSVSGPSKRVLPDAAAWVNYFRPKPTHLKEVLGQILRTDPVYMCGPVLFELSQGLKTAETRASLVEAVAALRYVEMTRDLWVKAGELSFDLKKQGASLPFSNILIASVALQHGLLILTADKHFEQIPGVNLYPRE